jgi:uncharacterized protein (DUF488 family)
VKALYTVGHSVHSWEHFLALLKQHGVNALCDVRSSPYSRYSPQFNREALKKTLKAEGIAYVFMGKELGARSDDPACYIRGQANYGLIAATAPFQDGLARVRRGLERYTVALMCAEKDPLTCHRTILVARALRAPDVSIAHIHADGLLETNTDAEKRLLKLVKLPEESLFASQTDLIERAYDLQAEKIAYVDERVAEPEVP